MRAKMMRSKTRNWKVHLFAVATTTLLASCNGHGSNPDNTGRAAVVFKAPSVTDVQSVTLVVTGSKLATPRTVNLAGGSAQLETIVGSLPAGSDYTFTATAADATNKLLYSGSAASVAIVAKLTTSVLIYLLQVDASPPFGNSAPVIDSLVISSTNVPPGDVVTLTVKAHDQDAADTLSYAWTGTGGSFTPPSATNVTTFTNTWTAPSVSGSYDLTIAVNDNHGASVSVKTTVQVNTTVGAGSADVTLKFDNSPVVTGLASNPGYVQTGVPTALTAQASDPDGDTLTYAWSSNVPGTFTGGTSTSSFTLSAGGNPTSVTITVTVKDGQNLAGVGTLTLAVGQPSFNVAPSVTSWNQTPGTVQAGQVATFEVNATDPAGGTLTFAWSTTAGSLGSPTSTGASSTVQWTAPAAGGTAWQVKVTVTDAKGIFVDQVFQGTTVTSGAGGTGAGGSGAGGAATGGAVGTGGTGTGGAETGGAVGTGGAGTGGVVGTGGAGTGGAVGTGGTPGTVPGAPTGVTATAGTDPNTVSVSFVAPANNGGSPITGYIVTASSAGVTATGLASPIVVTFPSSFTGNAISVVATNAIGNSAPSAWTDIITTYNVTETFREPVYTYSDSIFVGSYIFDATTATVSNLHGKLSEAMTGSDLNPYPNDDMNWLTLNNQLSSVSNATLGGLLVATFLNTTTATFSNSPDGWSPPGYKLPKPNPDNAYALIFVNTSDPTALLTQAQIDKLAYGDASPGGWMGSIGMTGTTVAGYGQLGTMDGYPVSQVTTKQ
jgi:hypothetical protein